MRRATPLVPAALASLMAVSAVSRGADRAVTRSKCFGAAARDPRRTGCPDPRLRLTVVPKPDAALLVPIADCDPIEQRGDLKVCAFGTPADAARGGVALIGDSHAMHWLPALQVVASSTSSCCATCPGRPA